MGRFLLEGEEMVVAVNQHWTKIIGVIIAPLFGGILVLLIGFVTPARVHFIVEFSIYLWLLLCLVCIVRVMLWRREWFVATDRRLLLSYGLIWRKMAMMPMGKVTDMSFNQSLTGRFFGYGTYVMESAGQDQALQKLDFIPDAEHHYRAICAEIFGKEDDGTEDSNDVHRHQRHDGHDRQDSRDRQDSYDGHDGHQHYQRDTYDNHRGYDDHPEYDHPDYDHPEYGDQRQQDDTDPYGVPARKLPQSTERRKTVEHRYGDDNENSGESDDPGWYVSREDVSGPQQVRRNRDRHHNRDSDYYQP